MNHSSNPLKASHGIKRSDVPIAQTVTRRGIVCGDHRIEDQANLGDLSLEFVQFRPNFAPIDAKIATGNLAICQAFDCNAPFRRDRPKTVDPLLYGRRGDPQSSCQGGNTPDQVGSFLEGDCVRAVHESHSRLCLDKSKGIAEDDRKPLYKAMPTPSEHIGTRLRQEMERHNFTPTDVAKIFGVKNPSVYDWMNFGRIAKKHIPKLVETFGHDAEWWIAGVSSQDEGEHAPNDLNIEANQRLALAQSLLKEIEQLQKLLNEKTAGLRQLLTKRKLKDHKDGLETEDRSNPSIDKLRAGIESIPGLIDQHNRESSYEKSGNDNDKFTSKRGGGD